MRVANAVYTKRLFDQLQAEKQKSESLLLNVLPKPIALRIKNGETGIADQHPDVSILIADLLGLQELVAHIAPEQVVYFLNELFSTFDNIVESRGLEKIKTMGATYMAAAGVPFACDDHAGKVALAAIDMRKEVEAFNAQYNTAVSLRIGLSTGSVIAGVIGRKKFAYDVWGGAVNEAWQILSHTDAAGIRVGQAAHDLLKDSCQFDGATGGNGSPLAHTLLACTSSPK
jgi:class 3 adenylate cyclase